MVVYPGLEKLQEYAEKKGKDDFNDQASGDSQSLKTYLDQIKYKITTTCIVYMCIII